MNSKISFIILGLLLFSLGSPSFAKSGIKKDDFKVISSDRNSLTIEYTPTYLDSSLKMVNNSIGTKQEFLNVEVKSGFIADIYNPGVPAIPQVSLNIGVPSEFGNTIQVLSTSYKEINGKIIPVPEYSEKGGAPFYTAGSGYMAKIQNEELVMFGDYGLIRDLPVQSLIINPVQFDAALNKVKLYTRILFKVNFSQSQSISSGYKDELAAGAVINFNAAKYWAKTKKDNLEKVTVSNSVLSSGRWFRFQAPTEGFYKITRSMLSSYGIDANAVDPRTIKIYNNGGKMLSENITVPRPSDLAEVAITITGEDDGKFDEGDYILFYGRGTDFWDVNNDTAISRFFNYYSKENFFWITSAGAQHKKISNKESLNEAANVTLTTTPAYVNWEEDKINLLKSGRIFVGDDFSPNASSRTYTNKLDGRVDGTPINYKVRFINASEDPVGLAVLENTISIYSNSSVAGYGSADYRVGREQVINTIYNPNKLPDNRSVLKFNFTPTTVTSKGYIDYFEISYTKSLSAFDDYLMFFSNSVRGVVEYQLNNFINSNIKVFDVTDYSNVKIISNSSISLGECKFRSNEASGFISKYIAVGNDNFKTPVSPVEVTNSNLHGNVTGAKFIIITNKNFIPAAEKLKQYRENEARLKYSTVITDIDQIYNEFGGGLKDPTSVRDYLKYAYDNWQVRPEYVLFFGSGNYDYKNIEGDGTNFVPTWQATEDLYEILSYSTDDFFVKVSGTDKYVDLSTGRITIKSAEDGESIVAKIKKYEGDSEGGTWRNLITLIADDGWHGEDYEGNAHTSQTETLAKFYLPQSFDLNKIYLAVYPFQLTSVGRRKPLVNDIIVNAINEGSVIVNFVGHGSPEVWADERVFIQSVNIPQLNNDKYFFLSAATCDFAYFDRPNIQSAAEAMLLLKNAGCIAALSSARAVYSSDNAALMNEFFRNMFSGRDSLNLAYPIGYVAFLTKQRYAEVNDQKYYIFGDPLLRLNLPEYDARIDSVNGQFISPVTKIIDTVGTEKLSKAVADDIQIKALSNTSVTGHIVNEDGNRWSDFNGEGILTVFDSERSVPLEDLQGFPMVLQGGVIFRGRISVTNGSFSANFVVPKDISYENKNGKIVMYFTGNGTDGIGFTNRVLIGGTDDSAVNDGKGPDMEVYFDDTSFKESYLVNPNSKLIVKLSDQTGLNTTGTGIGHKLEGILNDQENNPIDFTNYFKGDLDSGGKSGEITYPFNNIETGDYKLQIKSWDVFNNFSNETVYFSVVNGDELVIRDIYNYPNPFQSTTTFTFQQNLNKVIDVKVKVYTVAGRLIREIERNSLSEKFVKIDWDGRDQDGGQIANGTYLYKIIVKTSDGEYNNSVLGKLAVIR